MNQAIIDQFINFQQAHFDHDMIGMCKSTVEWLSVISLEIPEDELPITEVPKNFYKLDPHFPDIKLRDKTVEMLAYFTRHNKETDSLVKLKSLYVAVVAMTYVFHMPTEKILEASKTFKGEFSREQAKEMLLADNMSSNWIKEPSGTDFTAVML
jgi:hypothetical protein